MLKNIGFFLIAILVAWYFAENLSDIALVGGESVRSLAHFLVPEDFDKREGQFYAQFFIWLVILWFARKIIIEGLARIFGFLVPGAKRYSESSAVRLMQGMCFELFVILVCAGVIAVLIQFIPYVDQRVKATLLEEKGLIVIRDEKTLPLGIQHEILAGLDMLSVLGIEASGNSPVYRDKANEMVSDIYSYMLHGEDDSLQSASRTFLIELGVIDLDGDELAITVGSKIRKTPREVPTQYSDQQITEHILNNQQQFPRIGDPYISTNQALVYRVGIPRRVYDNVHDDQDFIKSILPSGAEVRNQIYNVIRGDGFELARVLLPSTRAIEAPYKSKARNSHESDIELRQYNDVVRAISPHVFAQIQTEIIDQMPPATRTVYDEAEVVVRSTDPAAIEGGVQAFAGILAAQLSRIHPIKLRLQLWVETIAQFYWAIIPLALFIGLAISFTSKPLLCALYAPIIRFFDQGRMGRGGTARFAGYIEEWKYLLSENPGGLRIGRSRFNPFLDLAIQDKRHMLTIAGTRSGKGSTAIIPNLLEWRGSTIVIDPKGTNAAVTARRRRELGQEVHIIDPYGVLGEDTASFDPLLGIDPNKASFFSDLNYIVDALVMPGSDDKDSHWINGAKTILRGFIAQIICTPGMIDNLTRYRPAEQEDDEEAPNILAAVLSQPNGDVKPSLTMLRDLFAYTDEQKAALYTLMDMNEGAFGIPKAAAARIMAGLDTDEITNIISNANAQTEWLINPEMHRVLKPDGDFEFTQLKNEPTSVFVVIPPQYLEANKYFIRLFLNLAFRNIYLGGRSKTPILMIIDEFPLLGHSQEIARAFGVAASYNVTLWPFAQDFEQLQKYYKNDLNSMITNSRAVQVFGVSDPISTEAISKRLGTRATEANSDKAVPLREPKDVEIELDGESSQQYIMRSGKPTLNIARVPYYKDHPFTALLKRLGMKPSCKYDPDPDHAQ